MNKEASQQSVNKRTYQKFLKIKPRAIRNQLVGMAEVPSTPPVARFSLSDPKLRHNIIVVITALVTSFVISKILQKNSVKNSPTITPTPIWETDKNFRWPEIVVPFNDKKNKKKNKNTMLNINNLLLFSDFIKFLS